VVTGLDIPILRIFSLKALTLLNYFTGIFESISLLIFSRNPAIFHPE